MNSLLRKPMIFFLTPDQILLMLLNSDKIRLSQTFFLSQLFFFYIIYTLIDKFFPVICQCLSDFLYSIGDIPFSFLNTLLK